MKPICVACGCEMKTKQIGVIALLHFLEPPQPYQAYSADLCACPKCGTRILNGFSNQPTWQHFDGKPVPEGENVIKVYENKENEDEANYS